MYDLESKALLGPPFALPPPNLSNNSDTEWSFTRLSFSRQGEEGCSNSPSNRIPGEFMKKSVTSVSTAASAGVGALFGGSTPAQQRITVVDSENPLADFSAQQEEQRYKFAGQKWLKTTAALIQKVNKGLRREEETNVSSARESLSNTVDQAQARIQEQQTSFEWYMYSVLSAAAGVFLIFLASLFIPVVVLVPHKFALLLTLGSLLLLNSVALVKGYKALCVHMFMDKKRSVVSALYITSLAGTLYATLVLRAYILILCCAGLELAATAVLFLSYVSGASRALSLIKGGFMRVVSYVFYSSGSILPI